MGDDMETSNVFDYDWERDFPDEDTIQSEWANFSEWNADKLRNGFLPYYYQSDTAFRVQADPQDRLVFAEKVKGRKQYYATKVIWYETIDRYLVEYYELAKRRDGDSTITVEFPDELSERFRQNNARSQKTQKRLLVELDGFFELESAGIEFESGNVCRTPKFTHAAYLNLLLKDLQKRKNDKQRLNSIYYMGLPYGSLPGETPIPKFSLEDYIEHEYQTAISLSIEISAVLLEFEDDALRDRALEEFSKECLPKLIRSRMMFSRNTAARHYFQQILLGIYETKYRWKSISNPMNDISEAEWERIAKRAAMHCYLPECFTCAEKVPPEQVAAALKHIEKLFSMVRVPVNFQKYVTEGPTHGLAIFCHPEHNNIDYYLNELKASEYLKNAAENTLYSRKRSKRDAVFGMVREKIRMCMGAEIHH